MAATNLGTYLHRHGVSCSIRVEVAAWDDGTEWDADEILGVCGEPIGSALQVFSPPRTVRQGFRDTAADLC